MKVGVGWISFLSEIHEVLDHTKTCAGVSLCLQQNITCNGTFIERARVMVQGFSLSESLSTLVSDFWYGDGDGQYRQKEGTDSGRWLN